jgi:hypothetical protein
MLILADLDDLEFVVAAGIEQPALPRALCRGGFAAYRPFLAPLVDLRNVAKAFDPVG